MSWWGSLVGGGLGLMVAGPVGAMFGAGLGYLFDKKRPGKGQTGQGQDFIHQSKQAIFFGATFSVLGYLAKVDGRVSATEIQYAEHVMSNLALNAQQRKLAINLFNQGKDPDFDLHAVLQQFNRHMKKQKRLKRMFLLIQVGGAMADGKLDDVEKAAILEISSILGISETELNEIFHEVHGAGNQSEDQTHQSTSRSRQSIATAEDYELLGVSKDASLDEVKLAYRKKMSQFHPDKLVAKGLPDEMMQYANRMSERVIAAYKRIQNEKK